jgi:hypothetical protein
LSFLHPEEVRQCTCGHVWRAEKWTKLDAQPPIVGQGFTRRAQDLNKQTVHEQRLALHKKWRYCPECGSRQVKSVRGEVAHATPTPKPATLLADELRKLATLHSEGVLTDDEFQQAKQQLLSE